MKPIPIPPGPGQESVWEYPRPPRLEPTSKRLQVILNGVIIADTTRGYRVLETSHPPGYYFPPADVDAEAIVPAAGSSICEWKGVARYFSFEVKGKRADKAAWSYPQPTAPFAPLKDYLSFYVAPFDACLVDGEIAMPQPGNFYGGWVTQDIVGPIKGEPGSWGW